MGMGCDYGHRLSLRSDVRDHRFRSNLRIPRVEDYQATRFLEAALAHTGRVLHVVGAWIGSAGRSPASPDSDGAFSYGVPGLSRQVFGVAVDCSAPICGFQPVPVVAARVVLSA